MVESLELFSVRLKDNRPQILTGIEYHKRKLVLIWEDYLGYMLSARYTKIGDDYKALSELWEEEIPKGEKQIIAV